MVEKNKTDITEKSRQMEIIEKENSSIEIIRFPIKSFLFVTFTFILIFFVWTGFQDLVIKVFEYYKLLLAVILIILSFSLYHYSKVFRHKRKIKNATKRIYELEQEELQSKEDKEFIHKLIQINVKYLDRYYNQTQIQANRSFLVSLFTSILAFLIIVYGLNLAIRNEFNIGILTATVGVIVELVSGLFFVLYNKTILKMSEYHNKLMLSQNVSFAIKLIESEKDNIELKKELINRLTENINLYIGGK